MKYEKIKELIAQGEVEVALHTLKNEVDFRSKYSNEMIHLLGDIDNLRRSEIRGILSIDETNLERNRITNRILHLIEDLEKPEELNNEIESTEVELLLEELKLSQQYKFFKKYNILTLYDFGRLNTKKLQKMGIVDHEIVTIILGRVKLQKEYLTFAFKKFGLVILIVFLLISFISKYYESDFLDSEKLTFKVGSKELSENFSDIYLFIYSFFKLKSRTSTLDHDLLIIHTVISFCKLILLWNLFNLSVLEFKSDRIQELNNRVVIVSSFILTQLTASIIIFRVQDHEILSSGFYLTFGLVFLIVLTNFKALSQQIQEEFFGNEDNYLSIWILNLSLSISLFSVAVLVAYLFDLKFELGLISLSFQTFKSGICCVFGIIILLGTMEIVKAVKQKKK